MADCHPILYLRMADRLKAGAKLIVVDPRRTTTAERADLFLQIKPGTDLALLNGLLHLLVENGDIDAEFIAEHTDGWDAMPAFLADYPPHRAAEITGIPESDIRTAARMVEKRLADCGVEFELTQPVGVDTAEELLKAMDSHDAELLVIGIRHRTPVGKLLLGSVSQQLLLECAKPVLAVKPDEH